jgi:hypothetical protein
MAVLLRTETEIVWSREWIGHSVTWPRGQIVQTCEVVQLISLGMSLLARSG